VVHARVGQNCFPKACCPETTTTVTAFAEPFSSRAQLHLYSNTTALRAPLPPLAAQIQAAFAIDFAAVVRRSFINSASKSQARIFHAESTNPMGV
jgi:hypothetical protein